jgi:hypothetical protein
MKKIGYLKDLNLVSIAFAMLLAALSYAVTKDKHLSADGVNYFIFILETHIFVNFDWVRQFSPYLSQLPLVLAVNAGLRDIPTLSKVFGFSILMPWFIAFGFSLYALRNEDKSVMLFMLISMTSVNLTSDYILVGEHQVMALICWPILFFLIRRSSLHWHEAFALWGLLFLFSRLYQTAIIPATIFLLISLARTMRAETRKQRLIFLVVIQLSALVIAIAAHGIFNPKHADNKAKFATAIIPSLLTPEALTSMSFATLFFAGWYFRCRKLVIASVVPVASYAFYVVWTGHSLSALSSFESRTLTLTLLPVLIGFAIGIYLKKLIPESANGGVFLFFLAIMITSNVYSTKEWGCFKTQMKKVLAESDGMIAIEKTVLLKSPQRWRWNNTQLSIVWSDGCVRSVVLNPKSDRWEPRGPPAWFPVKAYTRYSNAFLKYDADLLPCSR